MKTLKQQFTEFRSTTPKNVQWLLLVAAFLIVIILLTLVLGRKSRNTEKVVNVEESVSFDVDPQSIDLLDVMVGKYDSESISISVNMPVVIDSIEFDNGNSELTYTDTCNNSVNDYCLINQDHMCRL